MKSEGHNELLARLDEIFNNGELDNAQKTEQMYQFYLKEVYEEYKKVQTQQVHLKLQEELLDYKSEIILSEQVKKAQLILSKYEILTREQQSQYKSLKENHERIISLETAKRGDIISNFDNHLKEIKRQIREDNERFEKDGGGEVAKENAHLRT